MHRYFFVHIIAGAIIIFFSIRGYSIAEIYQHTDEQGIIHFSNQPLEETFWARIKRVRSYKEPTGEKSPLLFIENIIDKASRLFNIDENLIKAIIRVESDFNPNAISPAGARGLMQLMPFTAEEMNVQNIFDPEENILGGTKYLRYLLGRFSNDIELSLAAYNAGEKAVRENNGIPNYPETIDYVKKVIGVYQEYSGEIKKQIGIYRFKDENNVLHITNTYPPQHRQ
ncbi:MAG: transglycosylase SLT domain-containing protein [bacterium]